MLTKRHLNGLTILTLENTRMLVEIVPELGGKLTRVYNKSYNKDFLWHTPHVELAKRTAGDDYDTHFWGGIDELIPNDIPETIDGMAYPDHGELWTTELTYTAKNGEVLVSGLLPKSGLFYQKTISLLPAKPEIMFGYTLRNTTDRPRHFLWKLHAALQISPGDRLVTSASKARAVYPHTTRFGQQTFDWPKIEGVDASIVPPKNNTLDFFYLYEVPEGTMSVVSEQGAMRFSYHYDCNLFPFQWYFASYGKFNDHYTAILEPASAMPVSVAEAAARGQCSILHPGEEIRTTVTIYAGANNSAAGSTKNDI